MSEPAIPFGYRRITGQSQRGDGIWDGTRFRKVKKEYPFIGSGALTRIIIRKCAVEQPALAGIGLIGVPDMDMD